MNSCRCEACQRMFRPRPQNPNQKYCSEASCQRERKRRWQRAKRGVLPQHVSADTTPG